MKNYPINKNKYKYKAHTGVKVFVEYKKNMCIYPAELELEGVIVCYSGRLMKYVEENECIKKIKGFDGDFYILEDRDCRIGIMGNFGIGAPAVVTMLEEVLTYGVKNIISVGEAGSLQKGVRIGDVVLCKKSIRDEGTSYHYLKPAKYVKPDKQLNKRIVKSLKKAGLSFTKGINWTIDTPYRETKKEIEEYKKEGVVTVDMEASALLAVARYRKVNASALFVVSDYVGGKKWQQEYHNSYSKLKKIYNIAKNTLKNL